MALHINDRHVQRQARGQSRRDLVNIAHRIAGLAAATSPVDEHVFASGFDVHEAGYPAVANDTEGAFYIEFGTSDTPAHGTLTAAARRFGRYHGYQPRSPGERA